MGSGDRGKAKTKYGWSKIINKLITHVGHDDAAAVTEDDLIEWKDKLVSSGLSPTTIENHLTVLRTLYNYARDNKRIPISPAADVKYRAKPDPRRKRRGYNEDDAGRILEAARKENYAHLRWVPWIEACTGARLDEICGAHAADVYEFGRVWCLDIRFDNRGADGSLKNEGSERKVPLHPALIAEGFLDYVRSLPKDGPLFPGITPDRFGSRAGNGTKTIGRWIRERVGITDPRKAPNHSWRHYFKSACRDAEIEEDITMRLLATKATAARGGITVNITFECFIARSARSRARSNRGEPVTRPVERNRTVNEVVPDPDRRWVGSPRRGFFVRPAGSYFSASFDGAEQFGTLPEVVEI